MTKLQNFNLHDILELFRSLNQDSYLKIDVCIYLSFLYTPYVT